MMENRELDLAVVIKERRTGHALSVTVKHVAMLHLPRCRTRLFQTGSNLSHKGQSQ